MRFCERLIVGALVVLLTHAAARAEVKVAIEHRGAAEATAGFKFKSISPPAKNDAASKAKFSIVDGSRDEAGGDLTVLHDGNLPTEEDQPDRNFFFAQGQDGGRLQIDLGKAIDVKAVNTYSWHPSTRGPQIYKLYAADGSAPAFDPQPKRDADPAKLGWKLVAAVDTRSTNGNAGGQYGVSISDPAGGLGKFRFLLFDIVATEKDDSFGNTFFSKINVIDAAAPKPPDIAAAPVARLISQSPASAPYQISIDYTDAPELQDWVVKKLQPTADEWYPKIIEALPSKDYTAPKRVTIAITNKYNGVAATGGTHVDCNATWFKRNYNGEAAGAVVHELVHVVQQYGRARRGTPNPGWLVEGIADYIRWFKYEPKPTGTRPRNPNTAKYTDSYRITAGFLNFVVEKHDKQVIEKLNAAMRQGEYNADRWKEYTGKTVDELWKEYAATLRP